MKEPIKNQQFSGQRFDPFNFNFYWRTKVIYQNQIFHVWRPKVMNLKNHRDNSPVVLFLPNTS
jgi:hypothetical protein